MITLWADVGIGPYSIVPQDTKTPGRVLLPGVRFMSDSLKSGAFEKVIF